MVKVYAIALVLGIIGLIGVLFGSALAENLGKPELDPGERIGVKGKAALASLVGFGMGGMSAEFSPLDLSWQTSLVLALVAAGLSILWVRYSVAQAGR